MKSKMRAHIEKQLLDNYEKYYRLAYSYVRNEADALDIVQESAYKAMKGGDKLKEEAFADTWIYRIVVNTALDFLRKSQKEVNAEESYLEVEQSVEEEGYANTDIMMTLSTLPLKDRSVLVLRYFENFKLEQIADMTGESLSTVKSRLYRAQQKLRLKLE